MSLAVLTAVDHRHEAQLVTALEAARDVTVARRCADVPELLSVAAAGVADAAIVSVTFRGVDRDVLRQLAGHGVKVLGMCERSDDTGERTLRQLGVHGVIHPDTPAEELLEAVRSLGGGAGLEAPAGPGAGPRSPGPGNLLDGPGGTVDPAAGGPGALDLLEHARPGAGQGPGGQAGPSGPSGQPGRDGRTGVDALAAEHDAGAEGDPGRGPSVLIAVWGPTGAPGRTTLAVTLAALAADAGVSTVLVDADTWGASIGQALGLLDEAPGLAAASRLSEQGSLDLHSLARVAPEVSPGLRVLTGLPRPDRWPEVRAGAVEDVLRTARLLAEVVVVDCGFALEDDEELSYDTVAPRRNAATLTVLAEADEVVVVGAADPIGLQRLVRGVQDVTALVSSAPHIVVNKVRRSASGPDTERAIGDVLQRFSGLERVTYLPWSPADCDRALWEGRTLVDAVPDSPLVSAIARVGAAVLPRAGAAQGTSSAGAASRGRGRSARRALGSRRRAGASEVAG